MLLPFRVKERLKNDLKNIYNFRFNHARFLKMIQLSPYEDKIKAKNNNKPIT